MKKAILNGYALNGYTIYSTSHIGSVVIWFSKNAPAGWVFCNHTKLPISDYAELYEKLKDIPQCQSEEEGFFYTPDFRDRVPQGANGNLGQLIEAGLPNITGQFGGNQDVSHAGAFYSIQRAVKNSGSDPYARVLGFDASLGETKTDGTLKTEDEHHVYGNSDTVQSPANACNFIIKALNVTESLDESVKVDDNKITTGNVLSAFKVMEEIGKPFTAWENITDDCTITFSGGSGGSTRTDYVIYNPYLKKYRYKGTFTIGHEIDRKIKIVDTKNRADMSKSYLTGHMNGITRHSAGLEFTTYNKTSNSVEVEFYNRNSGTNWDTCELSFEVDCSYTD